MNSTTTLRQLAVTAFDTLDTALTGKTHQVRLKPAAFDSALFVTWNKNGDLRGCIGTFTPLPLVEGIKAYALTAAFKDPRFPPIKSSELPDLEVAITILGPLEPTKDVYDWQIGKHGVKAEFPGNYSATFLPDVAEEQGWTQKDTLKALARKAGVESLQGIQLFRYEGSKFKMAYKEYCRHY